MSTETRVGADMRTGVGQRGTRGGGAGTWEGAGSEGRGRALEPGGPGGLENRRSVRPGASRGSVLSNCGFRM